MVRVAYTSQNKLRSKNYPNIKIKNLYFLMAIHTSWWQCLQILYWGHLFALSIILTTITDFTSKNLPQVRIKGCGCLLLEFIKWLLLLLLLRLYQNQVKYIAQQWVKLIKYLQITLRGPLCLLCKINIWS